MGVCWLCLCSATSSTTSKADLFSGKCSVTPTVTLEKNFMAAHGQLEHSQQWQFHCRLCAIAEPVWHPCLLVCLLELASVFQLCCPMSHRFLCPGENEYAAEAAFTLPGGPVVPSVEKITFEAVGVMQAASQNHMNKNSKWDGAASQK